MTNAMRSADIAGTDKVPEWEVLQEETLVQADTALVPSLPEPWPEPVNGARLATDIVGSLKRHIVMTDDEALTTAMWVLHAYTLDAFRISPILTLASPTKRCGKTTTLSILTYMAPRPLAASKITAPTVYRAVDEASPTLLLDEADTFIHTGKGLIGILNSGHSREGAYAWVTEQRRPRKFSTWCAKVIAIIGSLPDTLADRSIVVSLRRKRSDEQVTPIRMEIEAEFLDLRRQCVRWAMDNIQALTQSDPVIPDGLHNRVADNWRPLLAVAEQIGGRTVQRVHEAATRMADLDPTQRKHVAELLLEDVSDILSESKGSFITSDALVTALNQMEDRPYAELSSGRPMTKTKLAMILRPFGIAPTVARRRNTVVRGYHAAAFDEAIKRYVDR